MGLYAITTDLIQRLKRQNWGVKVPGPDGEKHDTGVQPPVDEILASLHDASATEMPTTWILVAPGTAPAIQIIGDGGIQLVNQEGNITTNLIPQVPIQGGSGQLTAITDFSVDVSVVDCVVTVNITPVTQTLLFKDGVVIGVQ